MYFRADNSQAHGLGVWFTDVDMWSGRLVSSAVSWTNSVSP